MDGMDRSSSLEHREELEEREYLLMHSNTIGTLYHI